MGSTITRLAFEKLMEKMHDRQEGRIQGENDGSLHEGHFNDVLLFLLRGGMQMSVVAITTRLSLSLSECNELNGQMRWRPH